MRKVFFAGAAMAVAYAVANRAIGLLNTPDDTAVAGGYFLLLSLVSVSCGIVYKLWRRL